MVRQNPELRFSIFLLGVHRIANRRRIGDPKTRYQEGIWLCTVGNSVMQFKHSMGKRNPLWTGHRAEIRTRICLGKPQFYPTTTDK